MSHLSSYLRQRPAWFVFAAALLYAALLGAIVPSRAFADDPVAEPTPPAIVIELPTAEMPAAPVDTPTAPPASVEEPTVAPVPDTPTPMLAPVQTELPAVVPVIPTVTSLPSNPWGAIVTVAVPVVFTPTSTSIPPSPTETTIPTETITTTPTPSWYPPGPECHVKPGKVVLQLNVPFIHQVNDISGADGNWACGPTSVAMALAYYGKIAPWPGTSSASAQSSSTPTGSPYGAYVTDVFTTSAHAYRSTASDPLGHPVAGLYGAICPTGLADWGLIARVLEWNGLTTQHVALTFEGVKAALKRGHPVLIGNSLTSAGHVLLAIGYTANNQLIVNDPYGNRFAPGYGSSDGQSLFYAWNCMRATNAVEVIGIYPPPATVTPTPGPTDTPTITPTVTDTPQPQATATKKKVTPSHTAQVAGLTSSNPTAPTAVVTPTPRKPSATPTVETLVASSSTDLSGGRLGVGLGVGLVLLFVASLAFASGAFWFFKFDRALNRPRPHK
ncbi:MAG: C39 family peptidase [Chloroflexia bacterium]